MSSFRPPRVPGLSRALLAALAAASLLGAGTARAQTAPPPAPTAPPAGAGSWHEGDPVPAGYHPARRVRKALVVGGASLFALPYLASSLVAASGYSSDSGTVSTRGLLWIPAAGPFVMLGRSTSAAADVLLVADGLAQIGGLTLFVYGLAAPTTVLAPNDGEGKARVSIAPLFTRGSFGAALVGRF
jgi:hypothetical protein